MVAVVEAPDLFSGKAAKRLSCRFTIRR